MNFEDFIHGMKESGIKISINTPKARGDYLLDNEALFQLPLISLMILFFAKERRKPSIEEIPQIVGECLESCIDGFKGSSQDIGLSTNLRIRATKAIAFLECTQLIEIKKDKITITEKGKKVTKKAISYDDSLSSRLGLISREYRNFCKQKQLEMKII